MTSYRIVKTTYPNKSVDYYHVEAQFVAGYDMWTRLSKAVPQEATANGIRYIETWQKTFFNTLEEAEDFVKSNKESDRLNYSERSVIKEYP